ncbi:MAG: hypothetical protein GIKADHBN_00858 [Phycisphaerales bacterium]|nr:hypothetical protein [Phycisphaerales bacterium]
MRALIAILALVIAQSVASLADACDLLRSQYVRFSPVETPSPECGEGMTCCVEPVDADEPDPDWANECECCPVRVPPRPIRPTPAPTSQITIAKELGPVPSHPVVATGTQSIETNDFLTTAVARSEPRASARARTGVWTL